MPREHPGARNRYRVYGRPLVTDRSLAAVPSAPESCQGPDAVAALRAEEAMPAPGARLTSWEGPQGREWLVLRRAKAGYRLEFPTLASFHVSTEGDIVRYRARSDAGERVLDHLLLNQVLPLAVGISRDRVLHASAVDTAEGALLFVGPTGSGKSTLAGAFVAAGHRLIADDCALVREDPPEPPCAVPAHPGLRLSQEARRALYGAGVDVGDSPPEDGGPTPAGKVLLDARRLPGGFCPMPRPLRGVVLLAARTAEGSATVVPGGAGRAVQRSGRMIEEVRPADRVFALLDAIFRLRVHAPEALTRELALLEQVTGAVSVGRLSVPKGFDRLADARRSVLRWLRAGRREESEDAEGVLSGGGATSHRSDASPAMT